MRPIRTTIALALIVGFAACADTGQERRGPAGEREAAADRQSPVDNPGAETGAAEARPDAPARAATAPGGPTEPLPDVTLTRLDGSTVPLADLVDGPTIVNFWATWCGPCRREMPELADLDRARPDVTILGIAVDSGSPEEILAFAERHEVGYPLFVASRSWANRHFDLFGMPTTLVVDAEGSVRERLVGPQSRAVLEARLEGP